MATQINATFENGVFVPSEPIELGERQKVRLTVEAVEKANIPSGDIIQFHRARRIQIDAELSRAIASSPDSLPEEL
jgi:predicted DNA-binding antitoxin AbrB/MazE fold protein